MPELADPLVTDIVSRARGDAFLLHAMLEHEGLPTHCVDEICAARNALFAEYDEKYVSVEDFKAQNNHCAYAYRKGMVTCDLPNWQCTAPACQKPLAELEAEKFED